MAQASASASANTGISAPGGNNMKNSPSLWILAIAAVVLIVWLKNRK